MSFPVPRLAHPFWLYLIWAVPIVLFVYWAGYRKRKTILNRYASPAMLQRIAPERSDSRRWMVAGLSALSILLLSVSLSGPLYGFKWRTVERKGVDIIVAIDCSRSMLAGDVKPNRLERARREIIDLINRLKGDRIGLVAFAGTAFLQCPLTVDYSGFNIFLQALSPDFLPVGGTALAEAIDTSLKAFDPKSPAEKAVILITDGEPTGGDPVEAAERARQSGVKLFIIGVGSEEGAPIPETGGGFKKDASGNIILSRLDEKELKRMAALTGGAYVRSVAGDMDWDVIYDRKIRGEMEAVNSLESDKVRVWEDRYQWPLAFALIALIAELILPLRKRILSTVLLPVVMTSAILMWIQPSYAASASKEITDGLKKYEAGDFSGALESFVQAQLQEPESPEISFDIGNANYKLGNYESAMTGFQAALKNAGDELKPRILYNMGNTAYKLGDLEKSIEHYEAALEADPEDEDAKKNLEFVKKRLEQQKQQKQEKPKDKNKESEDKEESKDGGEGQGDDEQQKSGDRSQDSGDEKDESVNEEQNEKQKNEGKDKQLEPESEDQGSEDKKNDTQKKNDKKNKGSQNSGSDKKQPRANKDERRRAENMLNRLNDQPGKAMIPAYKKRHIEKDW